MQRRTGSVSATKWISSEVTGRLHLRNDLHLLRKAWHMTMGMTVALLYWGGVPQSVAVVLLGAVLLADLLVETLRLRVPAFNERVMRLWGPLMRACEVNRFSGTPYYIAATLLVIALFPKPIAVLSILYLACGDPIASLFGILYGKNSVQLARGKSLIGCLAGVVTCFSVSFVFLKALPVSDTGTVLALSLLGGLSGGLAELVPLDLDDNFVIPVVSGFVLWLSFLVVGV